MKYKVGQKVIVKSLDWYNENKDEYGYVRCIDSLFTPEHSKYCGCEFTISHITEFQIPSYIMENNGHEWTDEMIEGLVEEGNIHNEWTGLKVELELSKTVIGVSNVESLQGERFMSGFVKAIIPPEGYQFKDENGNIINAQKIVLEKKKKEYPQTYEECCKVMNYCCNPVATKTTHKEELIRRFQFLLLYRDAYWKIAGEEMGLGKPWEPSKDKMVYSIYRHSNKIETDMFSGESVTFEFPTKEMRDAFFENFNKDIEICKEFL